MKHYFPRTFALGALLLAAGGMLFDACTKPEAPKSEVAPPADVQETADLPVDVSAVDVFVDVSPVAGALDVTEN